MFRPGRWSLVELEAKLGYKFKKAHYLEKAIVSSFSLLKAEQNKNFQRLEFLGDSVINLIINFTIYRTFPSKDEGELTRLYWRARSNEVLSYLSESLDLGNFLIGSSIPKGLSPFEKRKLLADLLEALVAAVFLDGGFVAADRIFGKYFQKEILKIIDVKEDFDPRIKLQRLVREKFGAEPHYLILSQKQGEIKIGVCINDALISQGNGSNMEDAFAKAAENVLNETRGLTKMPHYFSEK